MSCVLLSCDGKWNKREAIRQCLCVSGRVLLAVATKNGCLECVAFFTERNLKKKNEPRVNWFMYAMGANMGKANGGSLLENLTLPSTHPTLHIVMLGLDSAGKTTALYRLKFDQYVNTVRSPRSSSRWLSDYIIYENFGQQIGLLQLWFLISLSGAYDRLQLRENPSSVRQSQGYSIPSLGCR